MFQYKVRAEAQPISLTMPIPLPKENRPSMRRVSRVQHSSGAQIEESQRLSATSCERTGLSQEFLNDCAVMFRVEASKSSELRGLNNNSINNNNNNNTEIIRVPIQQFIDLALKYMNAVEAGLLAEEVDIGRTGFVGFGDVVNYMIVADKARESVYKSQLVNLSRVMRNESLSVDMISSSTYPRLCLIGAFSESPHILVIDPITLEVVSRAIHGTRTDNNSADSRLRKALSQLRPGSQGGFVPHNVTSIVSLNKSAQVVVASNDGSLTIYSVPGLNVLTRILKLPDHSIPVSLSFGSMTSSQQFLAVGSILGSVFVYSLPNEIHQDYAFNEPYMRDTFNENPVTCMINAEYRQEMYLLCAVAERVRVYCMNHFIEAKSSIMSPLLLFGGHLSSSRVVGVSAMAHISKTRTVFSSSGRQVLAWDMLTGSVLHSFESFSSTVTGLTIYAPLTRDCGSEAKLVVVSANREIRVFDCCTEKFSLNCVEMDFQATGENMTGVVIAPFIARLFTCGGQLTSYDIRKCRYNLESEYHDYDPGSEDVKALFSAQMKFVVAVSSLGWVRVYHAIDGFLARRFSLNSLVERAALDEGGYRLATMYGEEVSVWNMSTGEILSRFRAVHPLRSLHWNDDCLLVCGGESVYLATSGDFVCKAYDLCVLAEGSLSVGRWQEDRESKWKHVRISRTVDASCVCVSIGRVSGDRADRGPKLPLASKPLNRFRDVYTTALGANTTNHIVAPSANNNLTSTLNDPPQGALALSTVIDISPNKDGIESNAEVPENFTSTPILNSEPVDKTYPACDFKLLESAQDQHQIDCIVKLSTPLCVIGACSDYFFRCWSIFHLPDGDDDLTQIFKSSYDSPEGGAITALALSFSNALLVGGSSTGTVFVWRIDEEAIRKIIFDKRQNGQRLLTPPLTLLRAWDSKRLAIAELLYTGEDNNGHVVIACVDQSVSVWTVEGVRVWLIGNSRTDDELTNLNIDSLRPADSTGLTGNSAPPEHIAAASNRGEAVSSLLPRAVRDTLRRLTTTSRGDGKAAERALQQHSDMVANIMVKHPIENVGSYNRKRL